MKLREGSKRNVSEIVRHKLRDGLGISLARVLKACLAGGLGGFSKKLCCLDARVKNEETTTICHQGNKIRIFLFGFTRK